MNINKNALKTTKIALILSAVAVLIAAINLLVCALGGLPIWSAITIMLCMFAILFANLSLYSKKKIE